MKGLLKRGFYISVAVLCVVPAYADTSGTCSFMTDLAQEEGGSYGPSATNATTTASGQYQTTVAAMQECGLIASSNLPAGANSQKGYNQYVTWKSNPYGVNSEQSYLANPQAQEACAQNFASTGYNRLNANTLSYVGKTIPGTNSTVTQSGLVACAYYAGAGNCNNFFAGKGTGSAEEALLAKRMENAGPLDASCVTGKTDNTAYSGASNSIAPTASGSGMYCSPQVAQLMSQYGQNQVNTWRTVAGTPGLGYTMMGGNSVNEAAGIDPTTGQQSSAAASSFWSRNLNGAQYSAYSCIDNIMGSGIDGLFHLPSINDIKSAIENAVCQKAQSLYNDVTQPINSTLSKTVNLGNVGGFLPGAGLSSIGGSVQIQQGMNNGVTVNGTNALSANSGDTQWYGSGSGYTPQLWSDTLNASSYSQ